MSITGQQWVTVAKVRIQSLMQFHLVSSIYHFNQLALNFLSPFENNGQVWPVLKSTEK